MMDTKHIVCPHCEATNRIPTARLSDAPKCGKCKQVLFSGQPINLTSDNFSKHITNSDVPVVVDFWAPWCGPCQTMAPAFEQAAQQLEPHYRLAKVDTEAEQALGAQYGIRSIPTIAVFKNGKEIARQAGAMGAADIKRWVEAQA
ncbi:MAG: thioredoxin TrxC [Cocleimonas sp.]|nr:thioredoxin TrxC [Cocleimonas sp.]